MLRKGLATEVRWFALYFAAMVFVGFSFGYWREAAILALALYVGWTFRNLSKLERWVHSARNGDIQENTLFGLLGEITEDIRLLNHRYEKDKQRLQSIVSRVQDMTSALNDGVILADRRSNIEWWNRAAKHMLALRQVDFGHRITNILRDPRFQAYFDEEDYGEPLDIESYRNEGQQLQFQIHPFGQGERLIIVRDVTRVAKLEQMRRDFVANVSHELRTPLTVVRGYVETLLDMPELQPTLKRALEQMQQQGQRMTALVNDLIMLTKLETDDRSAHQEPVNIHQLVSLIINDARAIGDEQHNFTNAVEDGLALRGNEKELRSAISNLVINAVKYSPEGCHIEVSSTVDSGMFALHVKDDGVGIDPIHIPRLTERFYRVDGGRSSTAGGTGLGLAIVKHVLIRHDAILKIASKPGRGSTFSCCFPNQRLVHNAQSA